MGLNTKDYSENGYALCVSCRKKKFITDLVECEVCDRKVCKNCATYRRQGFPYGYVCKACAIKMKPIDRELRKIKKGDK